MRLSHGVGISSDMSQKTQGLSYHVTNILLRSFLGDEIYLL